MTNIADLGVQVKVSGEPDLNSLGNTADKVGKKFSLLERIANGSTLVFSKLKNYFINLKSASVDASMGLDNFERNLLKSTSAFMQAKKAAKEYNNALEGVALTADKTAKMVGGDRGAAQANRFNSANFLAQFQDIAVTASMNMNPLLIALQQGTQLQYILAQSKEPLKDFVAGLKSAFSATGLLAIGLTGLVAVGIQMVDWVEVGKKSLNGLADAFDWVAENAQVVSAGLAIVGAGLLGHLMSVIKWKEGWDLVKKTIEGIKWADIKKKITTVASAIINKWILIPTLIVAAIEAFALFPDYSKAAVNGVIEDFVYMINKVTAILKTFVESLGMAIASGVAGIMDGSWETALKTFEDSINDSLEEKIISDETVENLKLKAGEVIDTAGELVEKFNTGIFNAVSKTSDKMREWAGNLGKSDKDAKKLQKTIEGLRNEYDELAISYRNKIDDIAFEKSTRGMTEEQKLVAQINHEYDQEIAKLERKVALKQIDVGLFAKEKAELDRLKEGYIESALEQEKYNESVKNFNSVMDYSSSVTKGFFSDLKKGLKDGESAWESFTNAVVNMLDKIQDKILDLAVDQMFNSLKQSNAASGSSNWLSGIINAGVSWVTGGVGGGNSTAGAFEAAGGAGKIGVKPALAANGGVFSNGVYSSPTVFKFAKGGKFGVMGEAGPEAVMPLRRGPDGSLGVKADGIGGSNVVVNVINNSNAQARTEQRQTAQGMEIDVMIDEMVGEKLARPGTSSNSALRAYNNRQLITR